MRLFSPTRLLPIVSRAAALAAAVVAAAYCLSFTSTSYGATSPLLSPLAISAVASPVHTALYPGHSVPVLVTLRNDGEHPLDLDARTIEGNVSPLPRGCRTSWFTFAIARGPAIIVPGSGGTATVTGRLDFVETNTDQSACAGATMALSLSVR
jgi:hypothetical protein